MSKNLSVNVNGKLQNFQSIDLVRFQETGTTEQVDYVDATQKKLAALTLNWYSSPTSAQLTEEAEKLENLYYLLQNNRDPLLEEYDVRIKKDRSILHATVERTSQYLYITALDPKDSKYYKINYRIGYEPTYATADIDVDIPTSEIEANTAARHTHENKEILDSITGLVTADKLNTPDHTTDLVQYGAFQLAAQQITDQIPEVPTALKNPEALTLKVGGTTVIYDGSSAKTVEISEEGGGGASVAGGSQLLYGFCSSVTASGDTNIYAVSGIAADINEGDMLNVFFIGLSENTKSSVRLSINGNEYYISRSYVNMSLSSNPKFFEAGSVVSFCIDNTNHAIITNNIAWDSPYYEVKKAGYTGTKTQFYEGLANLLNGVQNN